ncbi:MAG: citramalate synthase [Treponemataceae bacterium]|nr:citramalate synthase [Treponemataceae bacterium]
MKDGNFVSLLDSSLRDGAQGEGISFSLQDKLSIAKALDSLGVMYIEAGNPSSNPKDAEFFQKAKKISFLNSKLVAFGSTRRKGLSCVDDSAVSALLEAETPVVTIFGKSWLSQVTKILHVTQEENLAMISETVSYLKEHGRTVIFDAEHFFDGWKENGEYALKTLEAAVDGGASIVTLCDTKGGAMPLDVYEPVLTVVRRLVRKTEIGIHTHNDAGLAVANSLMAIHAGASHVQGTILGFGERSGNANLSTIIANLELKLGYKCLPEGRISDLTPVCREIAEITNISLDQGMPYVGINAFAHKAGMHTDAVLKDSSAYEQVNPSAVGNNRVILISEVTGRAAIIEKLHRAFPEVTKESPVAAKIVSRIKALEKDGYQFEGAEGSFNLLARKILGKYKPFFSLHYYKIIGEQHVDDNPATSFAQIKISVNGDTTITAGEGLGPVHALDVALRSALEKFYPAVRNMRLTDFKVRVLDSKDATAAKVRVLVESTDGQNMWTTVGVSTDLIEASWIALVDSFEYILSLSS